MKRLLLTGFAPFLEEVVNPSEKVVRSLGENSDYAWVDTLILPVSFKKAPEILFQCLSEQDYDKVVMVGQAGGRHKISLERVALNWVETYLPDESGYTPKPGVIDSAAEKALFSKWPLHEIEQGLMAQKIPAEISFSAGSYVCNYLYFKVTAELSLMNKSCLFVHVPFLPEQIVNKKDQPAMEFSLMQKGVEEILKFLKNNSF